MKPFKINPLPIANHRERVDANEIADPFGSHQRLLLDSICEYGR